MFEIYIILGLIVGAVLGSFLSVVINRLLNNEPGIFFGRSHCAKCKKTLRSLDLIPVFSYLINQGKCFFCHKKISIEYPLIEIACGLTAGLLTWLFLPALTSPVAIFQFTLIALFTFTLIGLTYSDLKTKTIPNAGIYALLSLGLVYASIDFFTHANLITKIVSNWHQTALPSLITFFNLSALLDLPIAILLMFIFFGAQYFFSQGKVLGSGDIPVAIAIALILGLNLSLACLVFSYVLGSLICLPIVFSKWGKKIKTVPFVPFLTLGFLTALLFGNQLMNWYFSINLF